MVNIFKTEKPRDFGAPVPADVVAPMLIRVKRDPESGEILTQSGSSDARYLNCEIALTDGPHKGGRIFARYVVEGSSDGAKTAQKISYDMLGSVARSALGLASTDMSKAAEQALGDFDFEVLDGTRFIGKTGRIERGKLRDPRQGPNGERYDDRATLGTGVTPDMPEWAPWKDAPRGLGFSGGNLNGVAALEGGLEPPPWGD